MSFLSSFFFTIFLSFFPVGTHAGCSDSPVKRPVNGEQSRLDGRLHFPAIQGSQTGGLSGAVIQTICCCLRRPGLPPRSQLSRPNPSATDAVDAVDAAGKKNGRVAPCAPADRFGHLTTHRFCPCPVSSPDRDREFMRSDRGTPPRRWGCILASLRVCDRGRCEVPLIVKLLIRASSKLSTFHRFWSKSPSLHCARSAWRWGSIPDLRHSTLQLSHTRAWPDACGNWGSICQGQLCDSSKFNDNP